MDYWLVAGRIKLFGLNPVAKLQFYLENRPNPRWGEDLGQNACSRCREC